MGYAWIALCAAFGLHIVDEELTDFLPMYNATVRAVRARFRFLPLPTFRHDVGLIGLIVVWAALSALSALALRHPASLTVPAIVFAAIMTGNGLLHLGASVRLRRPAPGVYSAPLLVGCGTWLLVRSLGM